MADIIALHKPKATDDISATLRRIADEIEVGDVDFPVTTAIVLLGHASSERPDGEGAYSEQLHWLTYGLGPRCDTFTCRGLMATALRDWNND